MDTNLDKAYIKKKAWYLGSWKNNVLADNVIQQVTNLVRKKKGSSVKLYLANDGLRVLRSNIVQGTVLTDFIPFKFLYFMTVNQHFPECLLVIAKDEVQKYKIIAFRCENALDSGFFIQNFKDIRRMMSSVEGFNVELKRSDGGNWTLRTKQPVEDKRQLSTFVDMKSNTPAVKQNGVLHTGETVVVKEPVRNGIYEKKNKSQIVLRANIEKQPSSPRDKVVREEVYRATNTQHNIGVQATVNTSATTEKYSDNVSEASESNQSFQNELNYLSNELREIKFMLEKSTGISAEVYHDKSGKETRTEQTEAEVHFLEAVQPIDAIVKEEEEAQIKIRQTQRDEIGPEIRVSVPDYRSIGIQASSKTVPHTRASTLPASYRETVADKPELLRASTSTNYQAWKDDVVLRGRVGRSARPRTALLSSSSFTSADGSIKGSLRGMPNGTHVYFDRTKHDTIPKGAVTYRKRVVSTSVQKPIEKVYQRPHSVHGSSRPYVVHHHHHHQGGTVVKTVPATLDLNQNNINGIQKVDQQIIVTNGSDSPSSPRIVGQTGSGFFIRT